MLYIDDDLKRSEIRASDAEAKPGPNGMVSDQEPFVRGCLSSSSVATEKTSVFFDGYNVAKKSQCDGGLYSRSRTILTWAKESPGRRKQCAGLGRGPSYGTKPCPPPQIFHADTAAGLEIFRSMWAPVV